MRAWSERDGRSDTVERGRGEGRGAGVGKATLSEAYSTATSSTPSSSGHGVAPTGVGRGGRMLKTEHDTTPQRPPRNADGSLPRLNLAAPKAGEPAEGKEASRDAAKDAPTDATPAAGDGAARGWGVQSVVNTVHHAAQAAGAIALTAAGLPAVTHETQDTAPGAPNTRTTVGVGEMITFHSNMPGRWTANHGASGFPRRSTGNQFLWAAQSTAGTSKITFNPDEAGKDNVEVTITVVAPTVDYLNGRAASFPGQGGGVAGVLMDTDVTFGPASVSFANTMWWERPGPASGSTGYFREHVTRRHLRLPYHRPNPQDEQIDATNSGVVDSAGWWDFNGPFKAGSFQWVIPTYYKVVDDGARHLITNVHQRCTIAADGTMTVTKGSASLSRTP